MYTRHAEIRCQQRAIPHEVVDTILTYGRRVQRHRAEICYLDKASRRRLQEDLGHDAYRRIADRLDSYVVLSDEGVIVTAAKRLRRIRH